MNRSQQKIVASATAALCCTLPAFAAPNFSGDWVDTLSSSEGANIKITERGVNLTWSSQGPGRYATKFYPFQSTNSAGCFEITKAKWDGENLVLTCTTETPARGDDRVLSRNTVTIFRQDESGRLHYQNKSIFKDPKHGEDLDQSRGSFIRA